MRSAAVPTTPILSIAGVTIARALARLRSTMSADWIGSKSRATPAFGQDERAQRVSVVRDLVAQRGLGRLAVL